MTSDVTKLVGGSGGPPIQVKAQKEELIITVFELMVAQSLVSLIRYSVIKKHQRKVVAVKSIPIW